MKQPHVDFTFAFVVLILIAAYFLSGCAEPDKTAQNEIKFPVTSNFNCASDETNVCRQQFYSALQSWYGDTNFSLKSCELWPGTCEDLETFEQSYRGY